jgi:DnaJ-domain-containing protein 1
MAYQHFVSTKLLKEIRIASHKDLERKLAALEKKYDEQFKVVFDAIRALMKETEKPKRKIGFEVKEPKAKYGKNGRK